MHKSSTYIHPRLGLSYCTVRIRGTSSFPWPSGLVSKQAWRLAGALASSDGMSSGGLLSMWGVDVGG